MKNFKSILTSEFTCKPVDLFGNDWPLLCAGKEGDFNSMTIGWGAIGRVWSIPYVSAFVRPTRYTYDFMEKYDYFSVVVFDDSYKDMLNILGTESGRDIDKMNYPGITPDLTYPAPVYEEAKLNIICKKMYAQDMDQNLLIGEYKTKVYDNCYSEGISKDNFHTIYYGEIINIFER